MRSTSPGKLSSSQDFSIGRSISLTRSSSVRALLLSTVWARELKADSTAETVDCARIGCWGGSGGALKDAGDGVGRGGGDSADSRAGGGLASSSAMMRRIEARISSIEGSVTFAGCVISDSTSSTPSHALFYTKHDRIGRFRMGGPTFSSRQPDLSPDDGSTCSGAPLPSALKFYAHGIGCRANRPASSWQRLCQGF